MADLIDNSIAAGAKTIDILWDWNDGAPTAAFLDDGRGMDEDELVAAMRFGGAGPDVLRGEEDLGRFGLGLKTASLSQCRRFVVASRRKGSLHLLAWDLDHIASVGNKWELLTIDPPLATTGAKQFEKYESGTLVFWDLVDFGRSQVKPHRDSFLVEMERLDRHLGMVFHRFIDGDARRVRLRVNGHVIKDWDPFLESHEATIQSPEQVIRGAGVSVRARGFVLPHSDRFPTDAEFERAGGPEGWTHQQGFYVYRHKRLLSSGGWLGLGGSRAWTREESSRLARIRVDIPNSSDRDWRIDVRKAIAHPPDSIRRPLQRLAEQIRTKAREVFIHRGQYGPRSRQTEFSRLWVVSDASTRRYAIARKHALVNAVRESIPDKMRPVLDMLLDQIERTVPIERVWLDVSENGLTQKRSPDEEALATAIGMARVLMSCGRTKDDAVAAIAGMEPFDMIDDIASRLSLVLEDNSA